MSLASPVIDLLFRDIVIVVRSESIIDLLIFRHSGSGFSPFLLPERLLRIDCHKY